MWKIFERIQNLAIGVGWATAITMGVTGFTPSTLAIGFFLGSVVVPSLKDLVDRQEAQTVTVRVRSERIIK